MNSGIKSYTKAEFDKLPNCKKRVLIAQDVLDRFNSGNILPSCGSYFNVDFKPSEAIESMMENLSQYINTYTCEVCVHGAIVCSWIGNFNTVEFNNRFRIDSQASNIFSLVDNRLAELKDIFGGTMLRILEILFEIWGEPYLLITENNVQIRVDTTKFYEKYPTTQSRLVALMSNIVNHRGFIHLNSLLELSE